MQVASRLVLVWGIVNIFPAACSKSVAYTTMLLAWSTTEVIRYSYFAVNLAQGQVPKALTWLRYNTFLVLYPMGISSECWLMWVASLAAAKSPEWEGGWEWVFRAPYLIWVPGKKLQACNSDGIGLTFGRCLCVVHSYGGSKTEGHTRGFVQEGKIKSKHV